MGKVVISTRTDNSSSGNEGAGESGKSTIVKQMKIIHLNGYTPQALLFFRTVVYKNLVESAQDLILAMKKLGVDCQHGHNRVSPHLNFSLPRITTTPTNPIMLCIQANSERILNYNVDSDADFLLDAEVAAAIESLINDPIIPAVMDQSHTFYLMDSAE